MGWCEPMDGVGNLLIASRSIAAGDRAPARIKCCIAIGRPVIQQGNSTESRFARVWRTLIGRHIPLHFSHAIYACTSRCRSAPSAGNGALVRLFGTCRGQHGARFRVLCAFGSIGRANPQPGGFALVLYSRRIDGPAGISWTAQATTHFIVSGVDAGVARPLHGFAISARRLALAADYDLPGDWSSDAHCVGRVHASRRAGR